MGDERGTEGDPLLVRPYLRAARGDRTDRVVPPGSREPAGPAGPTWPAGATRPARPARHVPAHRATGATGPIALPGPGGRPRAARPVNETRRLILLFGVVVLATVVLGTAGFLAFRPGPEPETPAALPADLLPGSLRPDGTAISGEGQPGQAASSGTVPSPSVSTARPPARGATTPPRAGAPATEPQNPPGTPAPPGQPTRTAGPATTAPATTRPPTVVPGLSPAPGTAKTGEVIGSNGRCLKSVPRDKVQVSVCEGLPEQDWTFGTDGTLRAFGKCAMTDSGVVRIGPCDGGAAQWRAGPNRTLVNLAANLCLTDPSNGVPGTTARVNNCQYAPNQQWSMP